MKNGCCAALFTLLAGMGMAQQAGFDRAAVLKELERLEQVHRDQVAVEQKSATDAMRIAMLNTKALLDLYQEAVFSQKFEGGKKDTAEFRKWRDVQDDTLKSDDFQEALGLHVNYLNLTLLRASGENEAKLNEALVQHVLKVWAAEAKRDLHTRMAAEVLERPVNQGVLARHFQLGPKLGGPQDGEKLKEQDKGWEWNPGNTDGMLDKTVIPFLRKNKSPALLQLWDKRLANETARAKRAGINVLTPKFTQQTLARLNWGRASDLVRLGHEAEGFTALIGILRQTTSPAEFDKYAKELRDLLAPAATNAAAYGS